MTSQSKRWPAGLQLVREMHLNFVTFKRKTLSNSSNRLRLFIAEESFFLFRSCLLLVKAGGMRIVQHKNPSSERAAKGEQVEVIGLSQNNPIDSGEFHVTFSPSWLDLLIRPNFSAIVVKSQHEDDHDREQPSGPRSQASRVRSPEANEQHSTASQIDVTATSPNSISAHLKQKKNWIFHFASKTFSG